MRFPSLIAVFISCFWADFAAAQQKRSPGASTSILEDIRETSLYVGRGLPARNSDNLSENLVSAALIQLKEDSAEFFCSGTLISPVAVVTAAHCVVDDASGRIIAPGSIQVFFQTGGFHAVEEIVVKRSYFKTDNKIRDDIAIILLRDNVNGIRPAALNTEEINLEDPGVIVGYGTDFSVYLPADKDKLLDIRDGIKRTAVVQVSGCRQEEEQADLLCVGDDTPEDASATVCTGDSGGGLYSGQGAILGVTSFYWADGAACGNSAKSAFVDVKYHSDWIRKTLDRWHRAPLAAHEGKIRECGKYACQKTSEDVLLSATDYLVGRVERNFEFDNPTGAEQVVITFNSQATDDNTMQGNLDYAVQITPPDSPSINVDEQQPEMVSGPGVPPREPAGDAETVDAEVPEVRVVEGNDSELCSIVRLGTFVSADCLISGIRETNGKWKIKVFPKKGSGLFQVNAARMLQKETANEVAQPQ
jgi:hypothetical protein